MLCQLNFAIRALAQIRVLRLDEVQVFLRYVLEYAFQLELLGSQRAFVIAFLNERRASFDPLTFGEQHRVA